MTNVNTETAIARVDENASKDWKEAALSVVRRLCVGCKEFFADDIWDAFAAEYGDFAKNGTHEMRAMGPVMRRAVAAGWCKSTGQYRKVRGSHNHLRPVWQSLIYES